MKQILITALLMFSVQTFAADKAQTFCGWVDNPTPANVWMQDRFGSITIGIQGGHQAEGDFNVGADYYTNGNYGSGCGCMKAVVVNQPDGERIATQILSSKQLPVSRCARDKSIASSYRPITLIHSSGKAYTECLSENEMEATLDHPFEGRRVCINEQNEYYYLAQ